MNWPASNFQPLIFFTLHQKGWIRWSPTTRITSSLQTCVAIYTLPASFSQGCPGHCTIMDHLLSVPMAQSPGRVTCMLLPPLALQCCCGEDCPLTLGFWSRELLVQFSQETSWVEGWSIRTSDPHKKKILKHKLESFFDLLKVNWRNCTF